MSDPKPLIMDFLERELGVDTAPLDGDTPLVSDGIIDSFSLMSLVTFVEERFRLRVGMLDINLANFDSLNRMERYIAGAAGRG